MASNPDAARLTELHRRSQTVIAERVSLLTARAWLSLMDPFDVDGSFARWFPVTAQIVRAQASVSAQIAAVYYSTFRRLEVGEPFQATPAAPPSADEMARSLRVTGPAAVKRAQRVNTVGRAMEIGRAMSSRSAARLALAGGRDTIAAAIQSDRYCIGYYRATSGAACAWCAMVASRGATYKSQESASFHAHDGCNCTAEPLFADTDSQLPAASQRYRELWDEVSAGHGGRSALNAFRRALAAG